MTSVISTMVCLSLSFTRVLQLTGKIQITKHRTLIILNFEKSFSKPDWIGWTCFDPLATCLTPLLHLHNEVHFALKPETLYRFGFFKQQHYNHPLCMRNVEGNNENKANLQAQHTDSKELKS